MLKIPLAILTLVSFIVTSLIGPMPKAYADDFHLPVPGVMIHLSPPLDPPILKGIKVHPDNPFKFDFILDKGDSQLSNDALKNESSKLIKYFLASLTIPEKDLWVNLSPYEKDRIIPNSFGLTEMGRDLLAEDYMLKQITASLIYPEDTIGKKFWKRIYEEAEKKFGTTNIPVNTFNKVWIVPEKAVVYENAKAGTAYVVEAKLKVMLEQDYLSLQKHTSSMSSPNVSVGDPNTTNTSQLGSQIVREIVIPELTKEVNEDKNFVKLRQVYNSLILATWYKKKIKDSTLEQVYVDKKKVAGVEYTDSVIARSEATKQSQTELIYQRYLRAFKKGVYNYIKEEIDPATQQTIPRKYFSGGLVMDAAQIIDISPNISFIKTLKTAALILLTASLSFPGLRVKAQNTTHQASDTSFHKTVKTMATKLITDSLSFPRLGINTLKADTSHMKKKIQPATLKKVSISGLFYDTTMVLRATPDVHIKEVIKQAAIQNKFDFKINDEQMQELIKIFKKENPSYTGKFVQNQDYEVRDMVNRLRVMCILSTSKVLAVSKLRNVTIYFIKNNIDDDTYDLPFSNNENIVFINMKKALDMDYVPNALDKEDAFMVKTYGANSIDVIIKSIVESILGHEMNHGVMFKNITEHVYDSRLYADTIFREVLNPKPSDVAESETKLELAAMLWQVAYDEFPQHALRIAVSNSLLKQDPHKYAAQILSAAILDKLGFGAYFKEAIKGKDNFGSNVSKEKLMGIQNSEMPPDYMQIRAAMGEDILDYVEDFLTSKSKEQPIISSDLINKTAKEYYEKLFGESLLSKDDVSKSLPDKIVQEVIEDYLYSSNSSRDAPLRFYSNGPLLKVKVGIKDGKPQKIDEILKEYKHRIDTNDMVYLDLLVRHSNPNLKHDFHFDPSEPGEMIDLTAVKAFLDGKVSITHELGRNITNFLSQLHKSNANMKLLRDKLKVGQDTDQVRDAISKETKNSLQLFKNVARSLSKNNLITNRTVTGDFEDGPIEELDGLNSDGITTGNERFGKKYSSAELMDQMESVLDSEDEAIGILKTFLKYEWVKKVVKEAVKGAGKHIVTIKNNGHKNGGIDFNAVNKVLESQSQAGNAIKFHIDPAMLAQLQNAPGFTPVIINMQPLKSLEEFLGISQVVA